MPAKPSGRNITEAERGTKRLTLRLPPEVMRRLVAYAEANELKVNHLIRALIVQHLRGWEE